MRFTGIILFSSGTTTSPYVDDVLINDERVTYRARISKWSLWPFILLGALLLPVYGMGLLFWLWAWIVYATTELAMLGCAGGNGFERIAPEVTRRVVGVDLNGLRQISSATMQTQTGKQFQGQVFPAR